MKNIKQIGGYLIWFIIALVLGIGYMRLLLGSNDIPPEGLGYIWYIFYNIGLFQVGMGVGSVIGVLFVLLDILYLKNRLKNNLKSLIIRLGYMLLLAIMVSLLHYVLEKVINVI